MRKNKNKKTLGRGLEVLLPHPRESIREIPLSYIIRQPGQPRKDFAEESLQELAASIQEHGILQPILVRPRGENYEIIAGERRWRACRKLGRETIPAIVRQADDQTVSELALIENLQREDLSILEEAAAYYDLWKNYGYTQEQLSQKLGKGRVYISNTMRLLQLSEPVLELLRKKQLTAGHARVILRINSPEQQQAFAGFILKNDLSVRQTEKSVQAFLNPKEQAEKPRSEKNIYLESLKDRLQNHFGSQVAVTENGKKGGKIELFYYDNEDLSRILELLGLEEE